MDESAESLPSVACPECGSTRLAWRVKRQRKTAHHASLLALAWTCRGCGAAWEEPLSLGVEHGAAVVAQAA